MAAAAKQQIRLVQPQQPDVGLETGTQGSHYLLLLNDAVIRTWSRRAGWRQAAYSAEGQHQPEP